MVEIVNSLSDVLAFSELSSTVLPWHTWQALIVTATKVECSSHFTISKYIRPLARNSLLRQWTPYNYAAGLFLFMKLPGKTLGEMGLFLDGYGYKQKVGSLNSEIWIMFSFISMLFSIMILEKAVKHN